MKKETIFTILLVVLVVVSAFQTVQLIGLSGKITGASVPLQLMAQASSSSSQASLPPVSTGMVGGC
ncbi:MAG: hypothetical protein HY832_02590 [Candidatus Aenigmarchaeota archaeon]|nr:hypothetical protein [Candidatus Aenigmarchaeota archaeon]